MSKWDSVKDSDGNKWIVGCVGLPKPKLDLVKIVLESLKRVT